MARNPDALPLRLTLAVLLPLLLLVVLAVQGMRARSKAAWDEIEEEAKRAAPLIAEHLAREFSEAVREMPRYPNPPLPGTPSPLDEVLDGSDPAALRELMTNPDAGISPAGLPREVLAALRLLGLEASLAGSPEKEREQMEELAFRHPSILSPLLLEKLGERGGGGRRWEEAREALRLLDENPGGGWFARDGADPDSTSFSWVEGQPDRIRYASGIDIWDAARSKEVYFMAPDSVRTRLAMGDRTPRSAAAPGLMAAAPIPFGKGLRAELILWRPDEVAREIRQKEAWTLSFVALASLVSIGGLWVILSTLRRERKLNEMKSQFVASVSHELRAPVASIRLMADALEEGKLAPETAKEFHRLIAREGARLSTLVGNVLDHARIEQGRRVWKMEATDLTALAADTLRVMQPLATEKQIALTSELDPVEAMLDAGAIQQALVNLLDNAIKFSPPSSAVRVTLSIHDDRRTCELQVSDEGPGVPKEEQGRIFERFYRPGDELRRETQGTGIGLSLVKSIAEAHRGSIAVKGEPGHGSTFILRIPLSA